MSQSWSSWGRDVGGQAHLSGPALNFFLRLPVSSQNRMEAAESWTLKVSWALQVKLQQS